MALLLITDTHRSNANASNGYVSTFFVVNAAKGVEYWVYQNIHLRYDFHSDDTLDTKRNIDVLYSEVWNYSKYSTSVPCRDYFLAPRNDRRCKIGQYKVHTTAWLSETPPDKSFKVGNVAYAGSLKSRSTYIPPPKAARLIHRSLTLKWDNIGRLVSVIKGDDLFITDICRSTRGAARGEKR